MIGQARLRVDGFLLGVALLAAACSSGGQGPQSSLEPSTSPAGAPSPSESSSPGPFPGAFVRTCETSVYGDLGRGWREDEKVVVIGPLAFLYPGGYANAPRKWFIRHGAGYYSQKVLAVVDQGAVMTVAIASPATRVASLLYDPAGFEQGRYEVSDGERAVTFQACPKGDALIGPPNRATQFNGGFIVAGPRCVSLEVWVGNNRTPKYRVLSFGMGDCART